ncbi:MAG: hypothetical protein HYS12_07300 [Planctomycetes bacterium]|nr:hypothetical protein [Planctomycetota bacterium]
MADFIAPTARAVFLCFHVANAEAGTVHLVRVFDAIRPEAYPHTQPIICVVVQFSDGLGEVPVSVQVIRLPDDPDEEPRLVIETEPTSVLFESRLQLHRLVLRLSNCTFPEPGNYAVEVYVRDECVGDALIRLHPVEEF